MAIEIDLSRKRIEELKSMKRPFTARQVEGARVAILNDRQETNANFRMVLKRVEIDFEGRVLKTTSHDGKVVSNEIMGVKDILKMKAL